MEKQEESRSKRVIWPGRSPPDGDVDKSRPPGEFDPLRRESGLVQWEASCMKNVAALLDDLESARVQWEGLQRNLEELKGSLTDLQAKLESALRERESLRAERERAEADLARAREEIEGIRAAAASSSAAAAAAAAESQAALHASTQERQELLAVRGKLDALRAELAGTHARLEMVEGQRDKAELARLELEGKLALIDELREEVEEERRAKESLAQASLEWQSTQEALARAHGKIEAIQKEADESMMLVCDLRYRLNKAEEARHEASSLGKQKVKKILQKIHDELDAAGAPRGEEMSFGERIRLWRRAGGPSANGSAPQGSAPPSVPSRDDDAVSDVTAIE